MVSVKTDRNWFAMRATYGRNLMAQRLLEVQKIESFVPMRKRTTRVGRRIKSDMVPVVRDLIFVCGEREVVQEAKGKIPYLHYITQPIGGRNVPIEVPAEQMEQFIAICNKVEDAEFLVGEDVHFEVGERVRITKGALIGREGVLLKIEGKRSKRFMVAIEGLIAVSVSGIKAEEIERVES